MRNYFIQKRSLAALFEGILLDRKNHKEKVFTIEHTNIQLYISSGEERDEYEYNTNTLRRLIRTRETATLLFSSTFNKSGARLLSETCARHSPPIRGSVQKDASTVTSAAGEFSIRRAHSAPLESIRLRFVFLFSFFLFHFGGRLVVSSFSRRPTERKPKRERGVCSSRGRIQPYRTSRRLPPRCKGFGFGFDARRRLLLLLFSSLNAPFARTMVVFVVSIFICARAHF